ncbi:cytochrome-c peroxidase [Ramlibacter sp.]|uniref:cytochrome-c peroxidase n=1 Tax=Ramlibacter sp. TaxID=1917967 RepID=UPI002CC80913|nr:cytochrome c peroxidase [Ramlibacter sp.]HWI84144.1 cytochrome c peroxidase [Ramlibacter sp.]
MRTRFAFHISRLLLLAASAGLVLAGCGGSGQGEPPLSPVAALGKKAFHDPTLSASGQVSCASCHAPEAGHAAPNARAVQPGGAAMDREGLRSSPSLRYLAGNGSFHFDADDTPTGGFFWDGRAASLAEQAGAPLLNPLEMANADKAAVVASMTRAAWAGEFKAVYGQDILDQVDLAFDKLTQSLQQFQLEDAAFHAYSSKYDAVLERRAVLTQQEARGLALFNDPDKGNCAGCHPSDKAADGSHPLFTDFTYDNLGVPRNGELRANADPSYFDLGLCGRADLADRTDLCGAFKVPSLRNVALRQSYFHNGRFKTLKDALTFYVQRDTHPEKWYPRAGDGTVMKFDDLPAPWHGNVNTAEAPYDRRPGDAPALSDAEIDDVIAFLRTLTDGWRGD